MSIWREQGCTGAPTGKMMNYIDEFHELSSKIHQIFHISFRDFTMMIICEGGNRAPISSGLHDSLGLRGSSAGIESIYQTSIPRLRPLPSGIDHLGTRL